MTTRIARSLGGIGIAAIALAVLSSHAFAGDTLTTLASLESTESGMTPSVTSGLALSGGTLYGTAYEGGPNEGATTGYGTVFSVPVAGGTAAVVASFDGTNGELPKAGLTPSGSGTLYGTTTGGGAFGYGTVFSVPIAGGAPTVLASFNLTDGVAPTGNLLLSGGTLYGTTSDAGPNGYGNVGTVFSVPTTGGTPTVLASFKGTDGAEPIGGLIRSGSTLYGTTALGGAANLGTVFSVPITGGTPTVLASFDLADGSAPTGNLILSGGTLYGTTVVGGLDGYSSYGTVFSVPITGGTPTVLASFDRVDGASPDGGLVLSDGILYGTTQMGGTLDVGAVFSVPITGGTPTVLASFGVAGSGELPVSGLILSGGNLYGATQFGGSHNSGTVFEISTPEPTAWALLAVSAGSVLLLRRRRVRA